METSAGTSNSVQPVGLHARVRAEGLSASPRSLKVLQSCSPQETWPLDPRHYNLISKLITSINTLHFILSLLGLGDGVRLGSSP